MEQKYVIYDCHTKRPNHEEFTHGIPSDWKLILVNTEDGEMNSLNELTQIETFDRESKDKILTSKS